MYLYPLWNFVIVFNGIYFLKGTYPLIYQCSGLDTKKQTNDMGGVYSGNCNMTANARNWIIDAWKAWALFIIECNKPSISFLKEIRKKGHRQKNYIWFEKCDRLQMAFT